MNVYLSKSKLNIPENRFKVLFSDHNNCKLKP